MTPSLSPFRRALARVLDTAGHLHGMGLVVSPQHVLSCAHVVAQALGVSPDVREAPAGEVVIELPFADGARRAYRAGVVPQHGWHPRDGRDLALLQLAQPLPVAGYARMSTADSLVGEPFQTWDEQDRSPIEGTLGPTLANARLSASIRGARLGCSGAPVVSPATGLILGLIVQDALDETAEAVRVIPAAWLLQLLPREALERPPLEALYAWARDRYGCAWRLRSQVLKLIRSYQGPRDAPRPFAGRSGPLQELDRWLAGPTAFKLLSGPAGRGKSALLLNWLGQLTQQNKAVTVFYVPISLRFGTAAEKDGVELLFCALCDVFPELKADLPRQPDIEDPLRRIAQAWQHMAQRPQHAYLLVLDGMDEAIQPWLTEREIFPAALPGNLHVLISARHKPGHTDGIAWLDDLRIPGVTRQAAQQDPSRWILELGPLDQHAMSEVVTQLGRPLEQLAARESFVEQLYRLTDQGDPLLLDLWVGEIWKQHSRSAEVPDFDEPALRRLKPGFGELYRVWLNGQQLIWQAKGLRIDEAAVGRVMQVLAVARGPMRLEELLEVLGGLDAPVPWEARELRDALATAHRLVIADGDHYVLVHPRLADHFEEEDTDPRRPAQLSAVRAAFLRWGARTVERLNSQAELPMSAPSAQQTECAAYLLSHHVAHLEAATPGDRRFIQEYYLPLLRHGWPRAWYAHEGAWRGYLNDLRRVLARLQSFNRGLAQSRPDELLLVEELRCAVPQASIRSLSHILPGALVVQLAREGIWSLERAGLIATHYEPHRAAQCLTALAALAVQKQERRDVRWLEQALEAIEGIPDEGSRAHALGEVAWHLNGEPVLLRRALQVAARIEGEHARARALSAVTLLLRGPALLPQAAQAAADTQSVYCLAHVLSAAASRLLGASKRELLQPALQATAAIPDERDRTFTLHSIGLLLEGEPALLREALEMAVGIQDDACRASALGCLAKPLVGEPALLQQALQAAVGIQDESSRADVLTTLARCLQGEPRGDVLQQALQAAEAIQGENDRAYALCAVAELLQGEPRRVVLQQALKTAAAIDFEELRADALSCVAALLGGEPLLLQQALRAIEAIQDEGPRGTALCALAMVLQDEPALLQEALQAAEGLQDGDPRARALTALAAQLQGEPRRHLLQQALHAAAGIEYEPTRADVLGEVAQQLPGEPALLQQALEAAACIQDEDHRARALNGVAEQLRGEPALLMQALEIAASIQSEDSPAHVLGVMATQLTGEPRREVLQQALQAVAQIPDETLGADALGTLAALLQGEPALLEQALQRAAGIQAEEPRSRVLKALAAPLRGEPALLKQALQMTAGIKDERPRAHALDALSVELRGEPDLVQQALQVAASIQRDASGPYLLNAVAAQLTGDPGDDLWRPALRAAAGIEDVCVRARALSTVASHLRGQPRGDVLQQALEATAGIQDEHDRASTLSFVAWVLQGEPVLLQQALQLTASLHDEEARGRALMSLAGQLTGEPALQQRALQMAAGIQDEHGRARALSAVAESLQGEPRRAVLQQALQAVARVPDESPRADALSAVAAHLAGEPALLQQALQAAVGIERDDLRARALSAVASQLAGEPLLQRALEAIAGLDELDQAEVLEALAPQLAGQRALMEQALQSVAGLEADPHRARALSALAAPLQAEPALLEQALHLAAGLEDERHRAATLSAVAAQLGQEPALQSVCLQAALSLSGDRPERIEICARLARQNPPLLTYRVWSALLAQAHLTRPPLLAVAGHLAHMAVALTGQTGHARSIAVTINEVCAWLP